MFHQYGFGPEGRVGAMVRSSIKSRVEVRSAGAFRFSPVLRSIAAHLWIWFWPGRDRLIALVVCCQNSAGMLVRGAISVYPNCGFWYIHSSNWIRTHGTVPPAEKQPGADVPLLFQKRKKQTTAESDSLERRIPDASPQMLEIVRAVRPYTMTSPERILALCEAVRYVVEHGVAGDIVECGVWRGGSMAAAARVLRSVGSIDRRLWLYDTFDGMTEPNENDVDFLGRAASLLLRQSSRDDARSIWCRSPIDGVRQVMDETGYPAQQIEFVPGDVQETLPKRRPERIALLRLDTDWYESTRCELEILFPRLAVGGVLIVDDYGHWQGCRRAVDEYFAARGVTMLLNRIDYTGRIGVKIDQQQQSTGEGARDVA